MKPEVARTPVACRSAAVPAVVYDVLREPGAPLDAGTRAFFEPRFGADFGGVRVHTGVGAEAAAASIGAAGFAVGNRIVLRPTASGRGESLLAHELAHVVQQGARTPPGDGLTVGSPDTDLERRARTTAASVAAGGVAGDLDRAPLAVQRQPDSTVEVDIEPQSADEVERLERDQGIRLPTVAYRPRYPDGDAGVALRELVEQWRRFVVAAARSTGERGVTARVIAAVLMEEIQGTPYFLEAPAERRRQEIDEANAAVTQLREGGNPDPAALNRSMGVGQVKPATAAAVLGHTPLVEQDRTNRGPGRAASEQNYGALSAEKKAEIIQLLAQPESNIDIVARLLTRLKNRPNRYPRLRREEFGTNERAVGIIATEYNLGATNTPEFRAEPSDYGRRVWSNMSGNLMYWFFPNI